jgi:adapter protein MecA 1/2
LDERDLKISDLAFHPEKIQTFFHEMMEQAVAECGFYAEDTPLMIEAVQDGYNGLMILVTKVQTQTVAEKLAGLSFRVHRTERHKEEYPLIFSFDTLNLVSQIAGRLHSRFSGASSLYKNNAKYFLLLERPQPAAADELPTPMLEALLSEYGCKHVSNPVAKSYLSEYGEVLIRREALGVLAAYDL